MFADFECPACGAVKIDVWLPTRVTRLICECGKDMQKRIAAPDFKITGFNAKNNYGLK